jgi:hypothetical protein
VNIKSRRSHKALAWSYRFGPLQERERKRQLVSSADTTLAWVYTLVGADGRQLATYNGSKVEYASAIGKGLDAAGNVFYTYNEPREGKRTGSTPVLLSVSEATRSKDLVEVAYIHSHPKEVDDPD